MSLTSQMFSTGPHLLAQTGQIIDDLSGQMIAHVATPLAQAMTWLVSGAGQRPGTGIVAAVCPQAPPGAQQPTDQLTGYVLWGVGILFIIGLIVGLGAVVGGRVFAMPHASKAGVVGLVVVFVAAVAYLVLPSMLDGILGNGCI